jgi:hypothetical protein
VQSHQVLARNRQQIERIGVAQVVLGEERDRRQVVERREIVGCGDSRLVQALGAERLAGQDAGGRFAQAFELERVQLLARQRLRRVPYARFRGCGGQRSSAPRGCARAPG